MLKARKIVITIMFIVFTSIIISGCTNTSKVENNKELAEKIVLLEEKNAEILEKIEEMQRDKEEAEKENLWLKNNMSNLYQDIYMTRGIIKEQAKVNHIRENQSLKGQYEIFSVHTINVNTDEREIKYYISLEKEKSLKEKIEVIAQKLSEYSFGLPIELVELKEIEDKKIAIINLKESHYNQKLTNTLDFIGSSWIGNYFQGSAGGSITAYELIETFLQRDYTGQWIDGVKFLYHNEEAEFDHIGNLFQINYR